MFEKQPIGCLVKRHIGGGTPSRQMKSFWKGTIPWASVKDFKDDQVSLSETEEYISPEGLSASASNLIPENTVVICSRMAVGRAAITATPIAINQDLKALFVRDGVDERYLLRLLHWIKGEAENKAVGSTVKGIRIADLLALEVPIAPADEQPTIANILDTLDTQIRQSEAIIAKLQQVKQGLLHDLLTRGIDESGQLRPPYEQAPELYKESPLGWVPKGWETVSLGDVASRSSGKLQTGPFGSQLHADEYVAEGIPVIMPQDINGERVDRAKVAYITENRAKSLARHRVISNDVVFSRRGDLSRCVAVNEPEVGWVCGTGCLLARFPKNEILGEWLSLTYKKYWSQKQIEGMAVGSTMPNLNTGILANLIISKPSSDEQQSILNYYKESEKCQSFEESSLQKLKKQKAGLMDDLLTGRIRVTDLIDQQQAS